MMAYIFHSYVYVIEISISAAISDCIHISINLLYTVADIFRSPVYVIDASNSAAPTVYILVYICYRRWLTYSLLLSMILMFQTQLLSKCIHNSMYTDGL